MVWSVCRGYCEPCLYKELTDDTMIFSFTHTHIIRVAVKASQLSTNQCCAAEFSEFLNFYNLNNNFIPIHLHNQ